MDRRPLTRSALLVTDRRLLPAYSGNRLRIFGVVRAFRSLGWKVYLVGADSGPRDQLALRFDGIFPVPGQPFVGGDLRCFDVSPFRAVVRSAMAQVRPEVAIAEYAWLAPALDVLSANVQRWIDCHDVLHERSARFLHAGLDPWTICTAEQEATLLSGAHLLMTCQERDADTFRALLPGRDVVCMMTQIDVPEGFRRSASTGLTVLAVGALHAGNDGIREFARDAWPRVLARVPGARLRIIGGIGEGLPPLPGVDVLGRVPDVHEHYATAAVVVCPVTTGSGVKTKMLEALRLGKAVVVTSASQEGIPIPDRDAWVVTASLVNCADAIADLLCDAPRRAALEHEAFAYGERYVSFEVFREQIRLAMPPERRPPLSVIVVHTSGDVQLRACLRALQAQSCAHEIREIVVVEVSERIDAAVRRDFPGVVVTKAERPGTAAGRDHAVSLAGGELVAILESGCRPARDCLERAMQTARRHGDACAVACSIVPVMRPSGYAAVRWYEANTFVAERTANGRPAAAMVMWRAQWGTHRPSVAAADARVIRSLDSTWSELRANTRRAVLDDIDGSGADHHVAPVLAIQMRRLYRDLSALWTPSVVPRKYRLDVALTAAVRFFWSLEECMTQTSTTGRNTPRSSAITRPRELDAVEPEREIRPLPLRTVTVVVPSYGWPPSLTACIESVLAQTVAASVEIVVVINGADIPQVLPTWPGVTVVHESKRGPAAARNAGVRASSGEVIAFIDADCIASPQWLDEAMLAMRADGGWSIVAGAITRSGADTNWISFYDSKTFLLQESYVKGTRNFVTANVVVHREVFDRIGPFDESFDEAAFEDWDWAMRAREAGISVVYHSGAAVDHPCMSRVLELKGKAARLARGKLLMRRKLGELPGQPALTSMLYARVRDAYRKRHLPLGDRARLMCVGCAVGLWTWSAARGSTMAGKR